MSIWEELTGYLSFSFVQYALIAGVLIALCSSLLGVTLVLKRFSVIGDGLSHVAFGALAIGHSAAAQQQYAAGHAGDGGVCCDTAVRQSERKDQR